jgi:hypothetical protein
MNGCYERVYLSGSESQLDMNELLTAVRVRLQVDSLASKMLTYFTTGLLE